MFNLCHTSPSKHNHLLITLITSNEHLCLEGGGGRRPSIYIQDKAKQTFFPDGVAKEAKVCGCQCVLSEVRRVGC